MSDVSMSKLIGDLDSVRNNPAMMQEVVVNGLEAASDGRYGLVDPSNPFVFLLESAIATGAAGNIRSEVLSRKQYASRAADVSDLYHHMSDIDYKDRFAHPGRVEFVLLLSVDEIKERAIPTENGVRKMTIPRETEITVEGFTFTLQYPIDIRVMPHGGLQVVYDTSILSPLHTLESNMLDWEVNRLPPAAGEIGNVKMLIIRVPIQQFKIKDHYDQLNSSSGFSKEYEFDNQYYYARVYVADGQNEWVEIKTTHSDLVYDIEEPTAVLSVLTDKVRVSIPQIYFTKGMLGRQLRVDIYTTHGDIDLSLERYEPRSYVAAWRDLSRIRNPYVDPILAFSTKVLFSTDRLTGGSNELPFEELRSRVIMNSVGGIDIPITAAQLESKLDTMGYQIVKDVDNITNRIYLAMKALNRPSDGTLTTGAGATIQTLQITIDNLLHHQTARDNGPRVTIDSGTLLSIENGIMTLVSNQELEDFQNSSAEGVVQRLLDKQYVFTPVHYVLDMTDDRFECRPYYLDAPAVLSKQFIDENESTLLEIGTMRYGITKYPTGYKLVVVTTSGDVIKSLADSQVHAQLSFVPPGEVERAYLNGVLAGRDDDDEFIFEFDLTTNFDVNVNDLLQLTSFKMYDESERQVSIPLVKDLDIIYAVSDYSVDGIRSTTIDGNLGSYLLPGGAVGVKQEALRLRFGHAMSGLWNRARSVASSIDYLRYSDDVYETYTTPVYSRDPITGAIDLEYDESTGTLVYAKLHDAGDPVLIDGQPIIKHAAGSLKLDHANNPIPISSRKTLRQMDLFVIEGAFAFVTDPSMLRYIKDTILSVVHWVTTDIPHLDKRLQENSQLWFYPQTTLGRVDVFIESGVMTSIASEQSFGVKFYLTNQGYDDLELRDDLTKTATDVIAECLAKPTVSVLEMASKIKSRAGDSVIDVVITGLGGDENYTVVTLRETSARLNIRKRLLVLPDTTITVQDDITPEWVNHSKK